MNQQKNAYFYVLLGITIIAGFFGFKINNSADSPYERMLKCYNSSDTAFTSEKLLNSSKLNLKNSMEFSKVIQESHTKIFDHHYDLMKRIFIAQKKGYQTNEGIPSYYDLFASRLNISDEDVNNFYENNPTASGAGQISPEERKEAVKKFLFQTKIQRKIDESLVNFESKDLKFPFYSPCPPVVEINKKMGIKLNKSESQKTIDFFVNPLNIKSRSNWTKISEIINDATRDYKVTIHLVGGSNYDLFTELEADASCMINEGEVAWPFVTKAILGSTIKNDPNKTLSIMSDNLKNIKVANQKAYKKCKLDNLQYANTVISFKSSLGNIFGPQLRNDSLIFINQRLFVHFESGKNPYILKEYLAESLK